MQRARHTHIARICVGAARRTRHARTHCLLTDRPLCSPQCVAQCTTATAMSTDLQCRLTVLSLWSLLRPLLRLVCVGTKSSILIGHTVAWLWRRAQCDSTEFSLCALATAAAHLLTHVAVARCAAQFPLPPSRRGPKGLLRTAAAMSRARRALHRSCCRFCSRVSLHAAPLRAIGCCS